MKDVKITHRREGFVKGTERRGRLALAVKRDVPIRYGVEEFVGGMVQKQKSRLALLKVNQPVYYFRITLL